MGILVNSAKNKVVKRPPPSLRARSQGVPAIRAMRRVLEKVSLPEASAGRGAFLMAGYFQQSAVNSYRRRFLRV